MAKREFEKDDYFKIDVEAHLSGDKTYINYYPGVKLWWKGVDGTRRAFGAGGKRKVSEVREAEEQRAPEEDRLIRTLPAAEVVKRTGRTLQAVYSRRSLLRMPDGRTKAAREA